MRKLLYLISIAILAFTACKKDDVIPAGKYDNGLVILNEGIFMSGAGSVSFWDRDSMTTTTDIYSNENGGAKLGNVVQSMTQVGEDLYFVVNNSNRIVITDKNFKYKSQIDSFELPRFMIERNGKAYVSQWGNDGVSGSLAVVDLATKTVTKKIPMGKGPENLLRDGNTLYIGTTGGYAKDDRLFIMNMDNESVSNIVLGDNPANMIKLDNGFWILCKGYFDFVNPAGSTNGKLVRLEGGVVTKTVDLNSQAESLVLSSDGNYLYFLVGGNLVRYNIAADKLTSIVLGTYIYKLGYDAEGKNILLADAKDNASNGQVYFMNDELKLTDTINVGIIPTGFYKIQ